MRRYETIFIIRPTVAEDEIAGIVEKTTSIIEGDGGSIIRIDKWGLKKLAYPIKKESQGYYVYVDYAGIPASVAEIERIFRIDDRNLKYMTVKLADSCDPDAIKELLAQEEQAAASVDSAEDNDESTAKKDDTKQLAAASSVDSTEDNDESKAKEDDTKQLAAASSDDSADDNDEEDKATEDDTKQETAASDAEEPVE